MKLDRAGDETRMLGMGLDGVELIMAVEEEFGVSLDDAEVASLRTPRDLIAAVWKKLEACHDREGEWTQVRVRQVIRQIIREQLGVNDFSNDAEFVRDLGVG
ncbi:acyl carrier protein [Rubritalea halochordaticola]|uniref:Acyl carrier protein n=1 Tax=Rubritalea halochordaticola TaxID=714537 RepID=A0ABP9UZT0_9BACT